MLFDMSPQEEDGPRKKTTKKRRAAPLPPSAPAPIEHAPATPTVVTVVEARCERCDTPLVDVIAIRKFDDHPQWLCQCGWCLQTWFIDPIPGLLETHESSQEVFRMLDGQHAGKTFDEIAAMGHRSYIEDLVRLARRQSVAEAAAKWLLLTPNEVRIP